MGDFDFSNGQNIKMEDGYLDFVFVIDGTESMEPFLSFLKIFVRNFYTSLSEKIKERHYFREYKMRARVIVFRDYFADGAYAMEESDFFRLPEENEEFVNYVNAIEAKGGGDIPENALEALALAMKSDWAEGNWGRQVILLLTDAPAHPLDKAVGVDLPYYPKEMLHSYQELEQAWNFTTSFGNSKPSPFCMDKRGKRLILFAPDAYPWDDIELDFEGAVWDDINNLNINKLSDFYEDTSFFIHLLTKLLFV